MTPIARQRLIVVLLPALGIVAAARAQEVKPPEFVGVRVGFADRYKAGLWTPLEVTLRGGSEKIDRCRVRASLKDSDGLNCTYEASEAYTVLPGAETSVLLYVRFGREESALSLELLDDGRTRLAAKTIDSARSPKSDQFADSLGPGQRLIVSVERGGFGLEKAVPGTQGEGAQNVVAALDSMARLPTRWQGYEGVDIVVISTSRPEVFEKIQKDDARITALEQWVRMGGTLVLCAGSHADEALHQSSPLARFVPGHFEKTVSLRQASGWETYAKSANPIPPPKPGQNVELPTPRLAADAQGRIEAHEADLPLVIRRPQGLGQVVFVATDLDRGPISAWSGRPALIAAILNLPPSNEQAGATAFAGPSFGYNDLAGQLRSALDVPRDVRLVPFYAVALLVVVYILLIGPGDYFLLRRLGRGMQWTWVTFPAIVVLFSAGAYLAAYWLKGDQLRVSQVDLVDVDAGGTARGASWFSVFSPRDESFDLSVQPRLPGGQPAEKTSASLAWLGRAGNEFNGMYSRDTQNPAPWSQSYAIAPSLDAIRDVPIQVWASKSFVYRWLGGCANLGIEAALTDDGRQLVGTLTNRLTSSDSPAGKGVVLSHSFLVYDNWAYEIGTLRPGEPLEIGPTTRRVSLTTCINDNLMDLSESGAGKAERVAYDRGNRDLDYVLQTMLFYDAAGGRKRTGMANDYQVFTDLSDLLRAGRAVLVAAPPQDGSCRGGDLLRGPVPQGGQRDARRPLGNARDRHATIYRFVLPVAQSGPTN